MRNLIRVLSLWWQASVLRLDKLIPKHAPVRFRLLFLPAKIFPQGDQNRAERLRIFLERQGPIFIKFGQLLSTRPDLLPDDISQELKKLQDNVPPFDPTLFKQLVEEGLGESVEALFTRYDTEPLASASLAQVHCAKLKTGEEVVIKVVRPGVDQQIRRDIRLMRMLAGLVNRMGADGRRLHAPEVVADYEFTIENELSMPHEAANAQRLRDNFLDNPINYTPKIYWDYVRDNILVMERIDGIPVNDAETIVAHGIDLKLLAETGVEIFFTQVFEQNFFHADMHPGNIFVSKTAIDPPQYISVDCAIVGSLTDAERYALATMLLGVFKKDYRKVAQVQIDSGWVAADTPVHKFEAEIRTVCEPIFAKPISEISFANMLVTLFSTARRFDMQVMPSLVLLEKTIVNIEGLGRQLYPDLDLWTTAQPFLERWTKERYSPKTLFRAFRNDLPEWLENFPEIPPLIYGALQAMQQPINSAAPKAPEVSKPSRTPLLLAAAIGCALGLMIPHMPVKPHIGDLSIATLALIGLYALVRK